MFFYTLSKTSHWRGKAYLLSKQQQSRCDWVSSTVGYASLLSSVSGRKIVWLSRGCRCSTEELLDLRTEHQLLLNILCWSQHPCAVLGAAAHHSSRCLSDAPSYTQRFFSVGRNILLSVAAPLLHNDLKNFRGDFSATAVVPASASRTQSRRAPRNSCSVSIGKLLAPISSLERVKHGARHDEEDLEVAIKSRPAMIIFNDLCCAQFSMKATGSEHVRLIFVDIEMEERK